MINRPFLVFVLTAGLSATVSTSRAQMLTVTRETFESQTVGSAFGSNVGGATSSTIVAGGTAPTAAQALQVNGAIASGFGVEGTEFNPTSQPANNGSPNTSTNLADYTLSFDLAFEPGTAAIPGFEVQLFNGAHSQGVLLGFSTAGMTANGAYMHFTTTLNNNAGTPFGVNTLLDPTTQTYDVVVDAVQGGFSTNTAVIFNVDNLMVTTVPEPTTYASLLAGAGVLALWRRRSAC